MNISMYNGITWAIGIAVVVSLAIAILSFALMIYRWTTPQRRGHVIRLLASVAAIPCLVGIQQAMLWFVFLPAFGREQRASFDAARARRNAESSYVHVGDPVPKFALVDADGVTFSVEQLKGKVVLINFFATWCGPCQLELPHVQKIWDEFRGRDNFQLLVIGREESLEAVRAFRSDKGFTFPIAPDLKRDAYSLFAKELIPRTLVISPDGVVAYSTVGFDEAEMGELKSVIARLLSSTN
jgi:peroxiredoxin